MWKILSYHLNPFPNRLQTENKERKPQPSDKSTCHSPLLPLIPSRRTSTTALQIAGAEWFWRRKSSRRALCFLLWGYAVLCLPKPPHHTPKLTAREVAEAVHGAWKHTGAAVSHDLKICFSWFSLFPNLDFELFWWVFLFSGFMGLCVLIRFLSVRVKWIWLFFETYFFFMQIIIS